MPHTVDQILDAALMLTEVEQSELTARLLEKLEPEIWTSDDWSREIQNRVDDIQSGRADLVNWEQARQELWNAVDSTINGN